MGTILHISTKTTAILAAYSVVGRVRRNAVVLSDHAASMSHASISWNGERWEVHDFASTNGTWVNGARVVGKHRIPLKLGDILRFGPETEQWQLIDDRGPVVVARCLTTGETKAAENGVLALPEETNVQVSILIDADGQWLVESSDGTRWCAKHGENIVIADQTWELEVPPDSSFVGTYKATPLLSMTTISLRFHMSHDGDHVRVDIVHEDGELSLGTKTRFDVLFPLAEARWKDARDAKLPEHDHGWYDLQDLMRHVGVSESYVNVLIFRIREALSRAGVEGAEGIVERRPKQLRLGTGRILGLAELNSLPK